MKGWQKGNKLRYRHGMTNTRTWRAWSEMKRRCFNPKATSFKDYGAKGITVCERWLKFEEFFKDMGACPDGLELERKDYAGNYEPGNCKWADEIEQQNNRSSNVRIEIDGIVDTIAGWARKNGVRPRTAAQRIRAGWPARIAVSRESDKGRKCA